MNARDFLKKYYESQRDRSARRDAGLRVWGIVNESATLNSGQVEHLEVWFQLADNFEFEQLGAVEHLKQMLSLVGAIATFINSCK